MKKQTKSSEKNYSRPQKIVIWSTFVSCFFAISLGLILMAVGRDYAVHQAKIQAHQEQALLTNDLGVPQTSEPAEPDTGNNAIFYAFLAVTILSFLIGTALTILNNLNRQKSIHYLKDEAAHRKNVKKWLVDWKKTARQRDAMVAEWVHKEEEISASLCNVIFSHLYGFEISGTGSHLPSELKDMSSVEQLLPRYAPHLVGDNPPSIEDLNLDFKTAAPDEATKPESIKQNTATSEEIDHE